MATQKKAAPKKATRSPKAKAASSSAKGSPKKAAKKPAKRSPKAKGSK